MKKSEISFDKFTANFYKEILPNKHPDIRRGQCLMNYLAKMWFEEYQRITMDPEIDCFYNDKLIPNTLNHLGKVW